MRHAFEQSWRVVGERRRAGDNFVTNEVKPGFIGRFANILGNAAVNIATAGGLIANRGVPSDAMAPNAVLADGMLPFCAICDTGAPQSE